MFEQIIFLAGLIRLATLYTLAPPQKIKWWPLMFDVFLFGLFANEIYQKVMV